MALRMQVEAECRRKNEQRFVNRGGALRFPAYLQKINGNLLVTGELDWNRYLYVMEQLVQKYVRRSGVLTVLLTQNEELLSRLAGRFGASGTGTLGDVAGGTSGRFLCSYSGMRNYHVMYGMDAAQIRELVLELGRQQGYGQFEQLSAYMEAFLEILLRQEAASLPAMVKQARLSDEELIQKGRRYGVSDTGINHLIANLAFGSAFRSILTSLQLAFETIMDENGVSRLTLSTVRGGAVFAMDTYSRNQEVMNRYLKEELELAYQRHPRLCVIAEDIAFASPEDPLLKLLMNWKKQRGTELVVVSRSAADMLHGADNLTGFPNMVVTAHADDRSTEEVTQLWGEYVHYEAMLGGGTMPTLLPQIRTSSHWAIHETKRLRVRAEDLRREQGIFSAGQEKAAVRDGRSPFIELVSQHRFFGA